MGPQIAGFLGIVILLGLTYLLSNNRKAIHWKTVVVGLALQIGLALIVFKSSWGHQLFSFIGDGVTLLLSYTEAGSRMVFGDDLIKNKALGFVFAFHVLPTVIFISSFFTLLDYLRVLPMIVRGMAWVMMRLMNVSGAESLSASANVFMGHTEAPLIIRPYLDTMTRSELLCLMLGGMATISGGVMTAYIGLGIEARALLTASVMAAPGCMVIAKILMPETEEPLTRGEVRVPMQKTHVNVIDALAQGAGEGMKLAINIMAMLIAFLAMVALVDALLGLIHEGLSIAMIMSYVFSPLAYLIGIQGDEVGKVAELLGTKLVLNEFVAYSDLAAMHESQAISERSMRIATYALCGFANFGAVGIQIGGIGVLAPKRRGDLAQLAFRALYGGFVASLISAAIAGLFMGL